MKNTTITKKEFIVGNKVTLQSYIKQEQKQQQYCYKPYRTIHNY